MKVLLVTGRLAENAVRRCAAECPGPIRVHVCGADVSSLLSMGTILKELSSADLKDVSMIILPGAVKGDANLLSKMLGVPCFKGPRNIADFPAVLRYAAANGISLSSTEPADDLLHDALFGRAEKELAQTETPEKYSMKIGSRFPVYLGCGISRVIAEINDAAHLTRKDLLKTAKYYLASGAKIIDLGMSAGEDNSEKIPELAGFLRDKISAPLSIDSLNAAEILAAADSGIDLILSIDQTNYSVIDSVSVPVVVIPRDKKGVVPASVKKKKALVDEILSKTGGGNVILDPVLSPVNCGFARSLDAYVHFRDEYPDIPMMLGAGNVTEMMDSDSVGVNALLVGFASELSIDLLFTTEASLKTSGAVRELSTAADMMFLAKRRGQPPKDLPLDLLVLKDKRRTDEVKSPGGLKVVRAGKERPEMLEKAEFRIYLSGGRINVACYTDGKGRMLITSLSAKEAYQEIIGRRFTLNPSHAAYLGKELGKAEIALRLGKGYVQDEDLFPSK